MQYATVCSWQCVHCDWLKHSQPPTHQVIEPITTFHTFLSHLYMYLSRQDMLANQSCVLYTCKSCRIVGELSFKPKVGKTFMSPQWVMVYQPGRLMCLFQKTEKFFLEKHGNIYSLPLSVNQFQLLIQT